MEIAKNPGISTRKLASIVGVNQSTAARWKNDPNILDLAARLNKHLMHK